MYKEKITQEQRILDILRFSDSWISGMEFLKQEKPITQFHARIWGLQRKGHRIESRWSDWGNYKEYKLFER